MLKDSSAANLLHDETLTPFIEIAFWKARYADLVYVFQQLNTKRMIQMRNLLEIQQSSYFTAFSSLYINVASALKEAEDISSNLNATQLTFEDFEQKEFDDIPEGFHAILHVMSIIWKRSKHFSYQPRHVVILLRETVNQIITMVSISFTINFSRFNQYFARLDPHIH
jgi:hypothetical protein